MRSETRKWKWPCLVLCSASFLYQITAPRTLLKRISRPKLASILGVDDDATATIRGIKLGGKKIHRRPKMFGHRGSSYEEPENTIPSFRRALEHGAHGIELDVFLLKDGSIAVFHGDGGDKMPGGLKGYFGVQGSIMNLTYDEARELEFHGNALVCPDERLRGASIPLLEEALQLVKDYDPSSRLEVKIELKGPDAELPVIELVERMDMVDRVSYISFHFDRLRKVRELRPQRNANGTHVYRTGTLFSGGVPGDFLDIVRDVDATEVHLRYDTCTKGRVEAIHDAGLVSVGWFRGAPAMKWDVLRFQDVKEEDENMYEILLRTGVQVVTVNHPGRLVNLVSDIEDGDEGK